MARELEIINTIYLYLDNESNHASTRPKTNTSKNPHKSNL